jgi:hypothetical protein
MAPKKTSLWSSSLHNGQIALGAWITDLYIEGFVTLSKGLL